MITLRRIYNPAEPGEQYRILVDRLWPRGISKEKAGCNEWLKEISPSNELRKWYSHDPAKWEEFKLRYKEELILKKNELKRLKDLEEKHGTLTLLYSSKEERYNNAVALKEFILEQRETT